MDTQSPQVNIQQQESQAGHQQQESDRLERVRALVKAQDEALRVARYVNKHYPVGQESKAFAAVKKTPA